MRGNRRSNAVKLGGILLLVLACCTGLAAVRLLRAMFPQPFSATRLDVEQPLGEGEALAFSTIRGDMLRPSEVHILDDRHGMQKIGRGLRRFDVTPSWSPDGTRLVYQSVSSQAARYWLVEADGANPRQVGADAHHITLLRWSPDGWYLAYLAYDPTGALAASTPCLSVTEVETGTTRQAPAGSIREMQWMPDGQALLALERAGDQVSFEIYGGDGHHVRRASEAAFLRESTRIVLAPDAHQVAYVLPTKDAESLTDPLYVSTLDGSAVVQVGSVWMDGAIVWSPDSTRLAFVTLAEDAYDVLCVVNAAGTGWRELLVLNAGDESGEIVAAAPAWSTDGTRLGISSYVSPDRSAIVVMNADGSDQRQVATVRGGMIYDLAWRPRQP